MFSILSVSFLAQGKGEPGVTLAFHLDSAVLNYTLEDGTINRYSGLCGVTEFQAPFYEKDRFRIGGTLSYRYMELTNKSTTDTQFAVHTGFGAGLQMTYRFLLVGADYHALQAKDFLIGTSSSNSAYNYMVASYYGGLIWQMGTLGLGLIYSTGTASIAPSSFTNQQNAVVTETLVGFRLNYNFKVGSKKFFKGLFKK